MKKYIPANIAIVRLHNNVIATSMEAEDTTEMDPEKPWDAPRRERRRYGVSYGESYEADYDLF